MLSDQTLLHILTLSQDATAVYDSPDLHICFVNQAMQAFWGKTGDITGKPLVIAVPELDGQPFIGLLERVWTTGETYRATDTPAMLVIDGFPKVSYFDFEYRAIQDDSGQVIAILHTATDVSTRLAALQQVAEKKRREEGLISELKRSSEDIRETNDYLSAVNRELIASNARISLLNERLQESDTNFKRLIAQAPVAAMVLLGEDLAIELANQPMLDILNRDETAIGRPILESMPELKGEPAVELIFETFRTGKAFDGNEVPVRMKRNGLLETRYFNFSYRPLRDSGRIIGVMDLAIEVTGQVRARKHLEAIISEKTTLEQNLRANEQRLQRILDTMAEGVIITDAQGGLTYVNPMAQKIMGVDETELLQRKYDDNRWQNERTDGTPLAMEDHPVYIALRTRLSLYDQEIAIVRQGWEKLYISVNAAPLEDNHQQVTGCIVTFTDVTNRIKLLQQKDDFISIASHELKTPVTTLKVSLQLLARMTSGDPDNATTKLIGQANRSAEKLSALVSGLLNSNRLSQGRFPLNKTHFNITDLINECCQHVRITTGRVIDLKETAPAEVYADEQLIEQVIVNLINNAVKYAPEAGQISVSVCPENDSVRVSVTDFGPGIPAEKLPYIFERYYRAGQNNGLIPGLGLGLYICEEIIHKHGGHIGVESEWGKGATFWFSLPS
ncbi:PAS domain-containing sensor histidine kinase [Taibaiella koreensis]|uniref:PAS domain-containing sensor histidine kinase n=1 Tax=Taibaiella koreensis TaxID=1268548 RepID=UPI000E5A0D47|nr:PAS domain-containing protein [Taibaiella koreensis]